MKTVQFTSAKLIETVTHALHETGLSAKRLELEITESLLLSGREGALAVLQQLRAYGVRIAMDDFGCGYSGLNYLRSFPFDKIKIDRSFVQNITTDPTSLAIVRAVIKLSQELGAVTTAEGVETEAQREALHAEDCCQAQGFLFSPALPPH
jgi:EAL domain-containing protein (putative c-di-GMP-specific phosphodiesterase class I)